MKTRDLEKRLQKDRPRVTVRVSMPEDVVADLERIAPALGFSGYQPLLRAYVGEGLRRDLERLEEPQEVVARRTPALEFQHRLRPLLELLEELKQQARALLERQGVPTRPPTPAPIPQVRVKVLADGQFRITSGKRIRGRPGQKLVIAERDLPALAERGLARWIGAAPPEQPAEPRAFGELTSPPYFDWLQEIDGGKVPAQWEEWGITLPTESSRPAIMEALWNAALVYNAEFELQMAAGAAFDAHRGSSGIPPEEALLWPIETLMHLNLDFSPTETLRRYNLRSARKAGSAPKYKRGIQAAVDRVYRDGMTEEACWQALRGASEELFTVGDKEYEFYVDGTEDEVTAACQIEQRTGRQGSIRRPSFRPYFVRASNFAQNP